MQTNLTYAFNEMQRHGLLARQNFMSCIEDADPAIVDKAVELVQRGVPVKGCCYYTKGDQKYKKKGWDFYLSYGPLISWQLGQIGISPDGVGRLVVRCLAKYGVDYVWNGEGTTKVMVKAQSIRKMTEEEAKICKMPTSAEYRMGNLERPYWIHFSIS